jgi:predicted nucleic acid-binding protein
LIALARIDSLHLLGGLFGSVCITTTVRNEILPAAARFAETSELMHALAEGWIEVVDVPQGEWMRLYPGVDPGEASSIHAACSWRDMGDAVLLVMDDRSGRREARSLGLTLLGTAAVIGLAKTEGLIPLARPLLERMARSGYYLGLAVIAAVAADVGE